jgi:8-oxo-dGTP pyrophosphatase MutT (NUDIX family)
MSKINYTKEDTISHDAIAAVLKNKTGAILMQKHVKYGFWTIPVGKVKKGQTIEDGLKEEIEEETNLKIKNCREIKVKRYSYVRNESKIVVIGHLFEVIDYAGRMKNNEPQKHSSQKFLSLSEVKKLPYLSDMTVLYLATLGFKRKAHLSAI